MKLPLGIRNNCIYYTILVRIKPYKPNKCIRQVIIIGFNTASDIALWSDQYLFGSSIDTTQRILHDQAYTINALLLKSMFWFTTCTCFSIAEMPFVSTKFIGLTNWSK